MLDPGEDGSQFRRRLGHPQTQQNRQHAQDAGERGGNGGDQHDRGDFPQAVLFQFHRTGDQAGNALLTRGADRHQRQRRSQHEQDQRTEIQRQRQQQRVSPGMAQHCVAAQANRLRPGRQRRNDLHQPAIGAFEQPLRRQDRGCPRCVEPDAHSNTARQPYLSPGITARSAWMNTPAGHHGSLLSRLWSPPCRAQPGPVPLAVWIQCPAHPYRPLLKVAAVRGASRDWSGIAGIAVASCARCRGWRAKGGVQRAIHGRGCMMNGESRQKPRDRPTGTRLNPAPKPAPRRLPLFRPFRQEGNPVGRKINEFIGAPVRFQPA